MNHPRIAILLLTSFSALCVSSCQDSREPRQYTEIIINSPQHQMTQSPHGAMGSQLPEGHPPINSPDNMGGTPEMNAMLSKSVASIALTWETPKAWDEKKGTGMRMVTFKAKDNPGIECSIVSLGGMAGGLKENISRWLGQIQMTDVDDKSLTAFIESAPAMTSKGGIAFKLYDFTQLQQKAASNAPSILATILNINDSTVFIKMTGSKAEINQEKENFKALCASLK